MDPQLICPVVPAAEWSQIYPEIDREYVWLYPLLREDNFDATAIWEPKGWAVISTDTAIYFHIPACLWDCPMCPFYREIIAHRDELDDYAEALRRELELYARHPLAGQLQVRSIYFGGGTASLLKSADVGSIISKVVREFRVVDNADITVECHPRTVNRDYLMALRDVGVNRVSFGIQSFQQEHLEVLRRKQDARHNRRILEQALETGFRTVSMDLIYRIPGQSLEDLASDIDIAEEIGVQSLSLYSLELSVRGADWIDALPNDKLDQEMFYYIHDRLTERGWIHGAQPDYALPGHENQDNEITWKAPQGQSLAIGAGAWSVFNGTVYTNVHDMKEYVQVLHDDKLPIIAGQAFNLDDAMCRYLVLGARCMKIPYSPFQEHFGVDPREVFRDEICRLGEWGLVTQTEEHLEITRKGKVYIDNISKAFYSPSNRCRSQPWGAMCKGLTAPSYVAVPAASM